MANKTNIFKKYHNGDVLKVKTVDNDIIIGVLDLDKGFLTNVNEVNPKGENTTPIPSYEILVGSISLSRITQVIEKI